MQHSRDAGDPQDLFLKCDYLLDDLIGKGFVVDVTRDFHHRHARGHDLLQMLRKNRRQRKIVQMAMFAVVIGETKQRNKESDRPLRLFDQPCHVLRNAFEFLCSRPHRSQGRVMNMVAPVRIPLFCVLNRTGDSDINVPRRKNCRDAFFERQPCTDPALR